jgi:hypothetical protein
MLSENPLIIDINIDQWRNLHSLFLQPVRSKKRITVIHENGKILNMNHSAGIILNKSVIKNIVSPLRDAQNLYELYKEDTDLVIIIERNYVERYYEEVLNYWNTCRDFDEYVLNMYSLTDKYFPYILTWPKPASKQVGLQGYILYNWLYKITNQFIPKGSTMVFCVLENSKKIWTSLILGIDDNKKISLITTINNSISSENLREDSKKIILSTSQKFWECSLGIFLEKEKIEEILCSYEPKNDFLNGILKDEIIVDPCPNALKSLIFKSKLHDLT